MPLLPTIRIHTEDIKKIMDMLEEKRLSPGMITIVDDGNLYMVRDSNGFLISHVSKGTVVHDRGG